MWEVNTPNSASWTWRKLLKLRPLFCPLIKWSIGDGSDISLWFDNWLRMGPIQAAMGDRIIYDSTLPRNAKVKEIIRDSS